MRSLAPSPGARPQCTGGRVLYQLSIVNSGTLRIIGRLQESVASRRRPVAFAANAPNNDQSPGLETPLRQHLKLGDVDYEALAQFRVGVAAVGLAVLLATAGDSIAAPQPEAASGAALELQQAYDKYSSNYDDLDGGAAAKALGFPQLRQKLLEQARGQVLEVAVGTGLNLPFYQWSPPQQATPPAAESGELSAHTTVSSDGTAAAPAVEAGVTSVAAVDLSPGMLAQAQRRVSTAEALATRSISFSQADVAALPFPASSFDSVVDTFSLCVFPDPQAALNEMARVVRPASSGGRVLLLEHSRSDNPVLAAYQDVTAGPVAALGKGCVWNQDVEGLVGRAGLRLQRAERAAAGTVQMIVAVKE